MNIASQSNHGSIRALDGRSIPYFLDYSTILKPRGTFLLLHGLGVDKNEYLNFYVKLSRFLCDAGFHVIRIDFPAHGESTAASEDFSLVNCIADAIVAADFAIRETAAQSLCVFGTSFGAGPAVVTANFFRAILASVTLLAPAISYSELYISPTHPERRAKFPDFFKGALLRGESVPTGERVALNWRNAVEFSTIDLHEHIAAIAEHTAIMHGEADSMVPIDLSRELVRRWPQLDLTVIDGMDHGFMDRDDEDGTSAVSERNLQTIFSKAIR